MRKEYIPTVVPLSDEFQPRRGWKLFIDDKEIPTVHSLKLINPSIGELNYGKAQEGDFDLWRFHEIGGGGSVILPFVIVNDELYVGVIKQMRPNMGGEVYCAIGGFLKSGETHFEAATRETLEELGFDPNQYYGRCGRRKAFSRC